MMELNPSPIPPNSRKAEFMTDFQKLYEKSLRLEGGLGAVAWAVLEMLRKGGMDETAVRQLHAQMTTCFDKPSNDECNLILRVVEKRLVDECNEPGAWY